MITFLAVVHIIACLGLVGLVLIQDSKGGGVFPSQSSSSSVLGASGATSLAQTMTKVIAGVFAVTCIALSVMSAHSSKSVVDSMTPAAAAAAATPEAAATTATPENAAVTPAAPAAPAQPAANEKK
jgi:preprotein translocase subunit SecG